MSILWSSVIPITSQSPSNSTNNSNSPASSSFWLYCRCALVQHHPQQQGETGRGGAAQYLSVWLVDATHGTVWYCYQTAVCDLCPQSLRTNSSEHGTSSGTLEEYESTLSRVMAAGDQAEHLPLASTTMIPADERELGTNPMDTKKDSSSHNNCERSKRVVLLHPSAPNNETLVVRVEVRIASRGGAAAMSLCTLHCSLLQTSELREAGTTPLSVVFQAMRDDLVAASGLRRSVTEQRDEHDSFTKKHEATVAAGIQREEQLLSHFLVLLNEKKKKIRGLEDALATASKAAPTTSRGDDHGVYSGGEEDEPVQRLGHNETDDDDVVLLVEPQSRKRQRTAATDDDERTLNEQQDATPSPSQMRDDGEASIEHRSQSLHHLLRY